jgi:hypothetical protein
MHFDEKWNLPDFFLCIYLIKLFTSRYNTVMKTFTFRYLLCIVHVELEDWKIHSMRIYQRIRKRILENRQQLSVLHSFLEVPSVVIKLNEYSSLCKIKGPAGHTYEIIRFSWPLRRGDKKDCTKIIVTRVLCLLWN